MKSSHKSAITLPDSVASSHDLKALSMEIRACAKWLSHDAIKQRYDAKAGAAQPDISQAADEVIRQWSANRSAKKEIATDLSPEALDGLIASLANIEATAAHISITLVAPATNELKKALVGWCRQNIEPNVLASFQFNTTLLGGMVVRYGSHIYDWSFRSQIMAGRQKFPQILREAGGSNTYVKQKDQHHV